jgi:DNA-directed RNA polymerase subunit RPC12/RpoP
MMKRMIRKGARIRLPPTIPNDGVEKITILEGFPTEQDRKICEVRFDICYEIRGTPLVVFLSDPDRELEFSADTFDVSPIGILEIDLNLLRANKPTDLSYTEHIVSSLLEESACKIWRYHPRQRHQELEHQRETETRKIEEAKERNRLLDYRCIQCGNEWKATIRQRTCTNCETHLFTTENQRDV